VPESISLAQSLKLIRKQASKGLAHQCTAQRLLRDSTSKQFDVVRRTERNCPLNAHESVYRRVYSLPIKGLENISHGSILEDIWHIEVGKLRQTAELPVCVVACSDKTSEDALTVIWWLDRQWLP